MRFAKEVLLYYRTSMEHYINCCQNLAKFVVITSHTTRPSNKAIFKVLYISYPKGDNVDYIEARMVVVEVVVVAL